nr:hypothetical protein [Paenibacillus xylanexedens]
MAISKLDYAKKMDQLGDKIKKAGNEYAEIPKRYELNSQEDIDRLKKEWLQKVADFREVQNQIKVLEIPEGFNKEGQKVRDAYERYVNLIEEKTLKFGIESMNNGELERLQKLELEASQEIKKLAHELAEKMFGTV